MIKSKTLKRLQRFEEAQSCLKEALEIQKEMYGEYHMEVTLVNHQLGELHVKWTEKIESTRNGSFFHISLRRDTVISVCHITGIVLMLLC